MAQNAASEDVVVTVSEGPAGREPRIESGSIVFGSDWPGLFVRGDDAFHYAMHLEHLLDVLDQDEASVLSVHVIRGLLHDLKSTSIENTQVQRQQLKPARECIAEASMTPRTLTLPGPPNPRFDSDLDLDPDVEVIE